MLRLIHSQTISGALLVDDIDDGLPNKTVHRMGSTADPKAYERDGYANKPKQPCYIPRVKPSNPVIAGYIDLEQTDRVMLSADRGKIAGLLRAGLISIVNFAKTDFVTPVVASATRDAPAAGDVTIVGTGFLSILPEITSVRLAGAGVGDVTLTKTQIEAVAPGAVTNTQIIIDSTLIAGLADGDTIQVFADGLSSNTLTIATAPVVSGATLDAPAAGDVTIAGTNFLSFLPNVTSVLLAGAGVGSVTLTQAQIVAVPPGAVTETSIIIDSTLIAGLTVGDTIRVTADGINSNVFTIV